MYDLSIFLCGLLIGWAITFTFYKVIHFAGTIFINWSDPNKDVYTIQIDDLDAIEKKKVVWFRVSLKKQAL